MKKILLYIVAYDAERFITRVLDSIPDACWNNSGYSLEVRISDDCSKDGTIDVCKRYIAQTTKPITVVRTPQNLGYGGNQKAGYDFAIQNGFDAVVLLHGDAQYDGSFIPALIAPLTHGEADAMLGSRMLEKGAALKGKMPIYKIIGNKALTFMQNKMLGTSLAEFHTGMRAYSTAALRRIPYNRNDNGFSFDTEILIQIIGTGQRIGEVPIAVHYGDEKCHVNSWRYGIEVLVATFLSWLHKRGLWRDSRFDYREMGQ